MTHYKISAISINYGISYNMNRHTQTINSVIHYGRFARSKASFEPAIIILISSSEVEREAEKQSVLTPVWQIQVENEHCSLCISTERLVS